MTVHRAVGQRPVVLQSLCLRRAATHVTEIEVLLAAGMGWIDVDQVLMTGGLVRLRGLTGHRIHLLVGSSRLAAPPAGQRPWSPTQSSRL